MVDRAAGQGLADAQDIRTDIGRVAGEPVAGPPETGGDLVGDEEHLVLLRDPGQSPARISGEWNRMPPAPWTSGSTIIAGGGVRDGRRRIDPGRRGRPRPSGCRRRRAGAGASRNAECIDSSGIRDRHRAEGVAVIAVPEAEEPASSRPCPVLRQNCSAIFSATSTAIDPESAKNTRDRPPGAIAVSRVASGSAGSCARPPNITCGIVGELTLDAPADMRVVVPVADAPPRRDAVDQLAAVGQHDPAAVRPRRPAGAAGRPSSGSRAARRGAVLAHTSDRRLSGASLIVGLADPESGAGRCDASVLPVPAPQASAEDRSGQSPAPNSRRPSTVSASPTPSSESETTIPRTGTSVAIKAHERRERMTDRTQVGAGHQDHRLAEPGDQVETRRVLADRRHHAARPLDQPDRPGSARMLAAEPRDLLERDRSGPRAGPPGAARRGREPPRGDRRDRRAASASTPRLRRISAGSLSGSSSTKPETTGLSAETLRPHRPQLVAEDRRDQGLADARADAGDEESAHESPPIDQTYRCSFKSAAARSMGSGSCIAEKANRSRAVPGRDRRRPDRDDEQVRAVPASPRPPAPARARRRMTGTIGLCRGRASQGRRESPGVRERPGPQLGVVRG